MFPWEDFTNLFAFMYIRIVIFIFRENLIVLITRIIIINSIATSTQFMPNRWSINYFAVSSYIRQKKHVQTRKNLRYTSGPRYISTSMYSFSPISAPTSSVRASWKKVYMLDDVSCIDYWLHALWIKWSVTFQFQVILF